MRGREEDERDPSARAKRANRSGYGLARGGKVARGAALLGAFFR